MQVAVDIATPGNDSPRSELLLKSVESGLARSLIQSAVTCKWSHQEIDSTRCTNSRCDVIDTLIVCLCCVEHIHVQFGSFNSTIRFSFGEGRNCKRWKRLILKIWKC